MRFANRRDGRGDRRAAAALFLLVIPAAFAWQRGWLGTADRSPIFAVGLIREDGVPDSLRMGRVLTDMVATNLSRIDGLRVLANSRVLELMQGRRGLRRRILRGSAARWRDATARGPGQLDLLGRAGARDAPRGPSHRDRPGRLASQRTRSLCTGRQPDAACGRPLAARITAPGPSPTRPRLRWWRTGCMKKGCARTTRAMRGRRNGSCTPPCSRIRCSPWRRGTRPGW